MDFQNIPWPLVVAIAGELGAGRAAIKKWRQRGVPHEMQIKILSRMGAIDWAKVQDAIPQGQAA